MRSIRLIPILAGVAAVFGCGAPLPQNDQAEITAPGGRETLPPLAKTVRSADRGGLLPPDAVIGGDSPSGDAETIVFDSRNPPARLLDWYRSTERDFRLDSELKEGAEFVLSGSTRAPDRDFTIRLAPGRTGGTSAMVLFTDR